jgi:3-oxoacyl-ACP reductase-like protein
MGFLSTIISKVFGGASAAVESVKDAVLPHHTPAAEVSAPAAVPAPVEPAAPAAPIPVPVVDVTAILDGLAAKNPEKLDWKKSIVDLLKLIDMDSSLSARKELAKELHYTGDTSDSAKMNVWLHKEVIKKIAENGGKVPAELLS